MKNDTKSQIAEALIVLLQKKPINKVTINEIAEQCGISRMTFYYHFQDIYDLVDWYLAEEAEKMLNHRVTNDDWQKGLLQALESVQANRALVLNVYRSMDREQIERYLRRMMEQLLSDMIDEAAADLSISDEGKHQVAVFYIHAFIGVVLAWISDGMQEEPRKLINTTSAIAYGGFRRSLEEVGRLEREEEKA